MAAPCLGAAGAEPTEPLPAILLRLRQGNADEQVAAVETLARVRSVELLRAHKVDELLLSIIARKDALPRLRRKAVSALVTLAARTDRTLRDKVLDQLNRLLASSGEAPVVRWTVAEHIWLLIEPSGLGVDRKAMDTLQSLARREKNPELRIAALRSLSRVPGDHSMDVFKKALLKVRNERIFIAALDLLGPRLTPHAFDQRTHSILRLKLIKRLEDPAYPAASRAAAMIGLARLKIRPAREKIETLLAEQALQGPGDKALVLGGARALTIFGDPDSANLLAGLYRNFRGPEGAAVRLVAVTGLGELIGRLDKGLPIATQRLIASTLTGAVENDPSIPVARQAAFWLGNLTASRRFSLRGTIEVLIRALGHADDVLRANCRDSLEDLTFHRIEIEIGPGEQPQNYQRRWRVWFEVNKERF